MSIDPDHAPTPDLAERFMLSVDHSTPLVVGRLATGGQRIHRTALGGTFAGDEVAGEIIGGGETLLDRPDRVRVIEASYLVRTDRDTLLRIIGTGYRTSEGDFVGTRMSIVFEVDEDGPHDRLSTRAFIAEGEDGALRIAEVL